MPTIATAVHVAVDVRRTPTTPAWVDVRRVTGLTDRARWHLGPPRDRLEDAVIDVATAAGDEMAAVGVLAEAVSSRRTSAARLRTTLDGRADHTRVRDRDRDLDRDLDAAVDGRLTVRLGWGQVVGRSCRTAHRVGELLCRRGWAGRVRPCRRCG